MQKYGVDDLVVGDDVGVINFFRRIQQGKIKYGQCFIEPQRTEKFGNYQNEKKQNRRNQFFCFSGNNKRPARIFPLRSFGSHRCKKLQADGFAGAAADASTAFNAGTFINHSFVVRDGDGTNGAAVNASTATGAGIFINFSGHFSFSF